MKLLSVIVPVYNVEKYLERCLKSILNQTYENMEILLIDDGSTDTSLKICNEYAKKDKRIRVIHQENKGLSATRNVGLDNMKGDYVSFVDSDDWINPNIYDLAIKNMEKSNADVLDFGCKKVMQYENMEKGKVDSYSIREYRNDEILERYLYRGLTSKNAPFTMWRKIFKKEVFREIRLPEGRINEDIITVFRVLMNCKLMLETDYLGYFYFQDNISLTRGKMKMRDFDLITSCEEVCELAKSKNKKIQKYARIKRARSDFSLLAKITYYGAEENVDVKTIVKKLVKDIRRNYFLLITSPIPINRKIVITVFAINYKIIAIPLEMRRSHGKK